MLIVPQQHRTFVKKAVKFGSKVITKKTEYVAALFPNGKGGFHIQMVRRDKAEPRKTA